MAPRSDDTPRRGDQPRRGTSRDLPADDADETGETGDGGRSRGFSGIGDARAYTPRGRTMAERDQRTRSPRAGRTTDPFRPALQVLDGGRPQRGRRPVEPDEPDSPAAEAPPRARRPEPVTEDKPRRTTAGRTGDRVTAGAARAGSRVTAAASRAADRVTAGSVRERAGSVREGSVRERAGSVREGSVRDRSGSVREQERTPRSRPQSPARTSRAVRTVAPEPPKLANSTRRLRLGTVLALSLFVMIGVRLVILQVASSPADAARLIKLREDRISEITLPAPRGSILDRDGTVLAHSVEARYVAADPALVKDPAKTAATLAPLLGVPRSSES